MYNGKPAYQRDDCYNRESKLIWSNDTINLTNKYFIENSFINNNLSIETQEINNPQPIYVDSSTNVVESNLINTQTAAENNPIPAAEDNPTAGPEDNANPAAAPGDNLNIPNLSDQILNQNNVVTFDNNFNYVTYTSPNSLFQ